jgi:ParB family transcriptional regulator, chromosome partitioning protein
MKRDWSVRELERRIKASTSADSTKTKSTAQQSPAQIHLKHLAEELSRHLGTRVQIDAGRKKGSGKLTIEFYSLDEFESLLDRLGYTPT